MTTWPQSRQGGLPLLQEVTFRNQDRAHPRDYFDKACESSKPEPYKNSVIADKRARKMPKARVGQTQLNSGQEGAQGK